MYNSGCTHKYQHKVPAQRTCSVAAGGAAVALLLPLLVGGLLVGGLLVGGLLVGGLLVGGLLVGGLLVGGLLVGGLLCRLAYIPLRCACCQRSLVTSAWRVSIFLLTLPSSSRRRHRAAEQLQRQGAIVITRNTNLNYITYKGSAVESSRPNCGMTATYAHCIGGWPRRGRVQRKHPSQRLRQQHPAG
jgi:hypothetical protein